MARRALAPATLAAVRAVEDALVPQDRALLVACSGGADSLALAAATQLLRGSALPRSAVVVDHGLQPGSAEVAAHVRGQLGRLGYSDVAVVAVQVGPATGTGPEAAARTARYAALEAEAEAREATVLLGHTRDDQAETVLLGLARGSGTRSLAGMAERSGRCLRPLLALPRTASAAVCAELGLVPWQDPHNSDDAYRRVRVRHRVLPVLEAELGPGVAAALARTARLARDDADLLDRLAAAAHPDTDTLDCAVLAGLPPALRSRVIRSWLLRSGAAEVGWGHVQQVDALVTAWHGQGGTALAGVTVSRSGGSLRCRPAPPGVAG